RTYPVGQEFFERFQRAPFLSFWWSHDSLNRRCVDTIRCKAREVFCKCEETRLICCPETMRSGHKGGKIRVFTEEQESKLGACSLVQKHERLGQIFLRRLRVRRLSFCLGGEQLFGDAAFRAYIKSRPNLLLPFCKQPDVLCVYVNKSQLIHAEVLIRSRRTLHTS